MEASGVLPAPPDDPQFGAGQYALAQPPSRIRASARSDIEKGEKGALAGILVMPGTDVLPAQQPVAALGLVGVRPTSSVLHQVTYPIRR